jgi:hypothetical protein
MIRLLALAATHPRLRQSARLLIALKPNGFRGFLRLAAAASGAAPGADQRKIRIDMAGVSRVDSIPFDRNTEGIVRVAAARENKRAIGVR